MTSGPGQRDRGTSADRGTSTSAERGETSRPGPRITGARRRNGADQDRTASRRPAQEEREDQAERDTPFPHDFGRDGTSGLVTHDRALRAREVSRPTPEDEAEAVAGAEAMLRRLGRRH